MPPVLARLQIHDYSATDQLLWQVVEPGLQISFLSLFLCLFELLVEIGFDSECLQFSQSLEDFFELHTKSKGKNYCGRRPGNS